MEDVITRQITREYNRIKALYIYIYIYKEYIKTVVSWMKIR
jgi:hypothetical protein